MNYVIKSSFTAAFMPVKKKIYEWKKKRGPGLKWLKEGVIATV